MTSGSLYQLRPQFASFAARGRLAPSPSRISLMQGRHGTTLGSRHRGRDRRGTGTFTSAVPQQGTVARTGQEHRVQTSRSPRGIPCSYTCSRRASRVAAGRQRHGAVRQPPDSLDCYNSASWVTISSATARARVSFTWDPIHYAPRTAVRRCGKSFVILAERIVHVLGEPFTSGPVGLNLYYRRYAESWCSWSRRPGPVLTLTGSATDPGPPPHSPREY